MALKWPALVRALFDFIHIFALDLTVLPFACVGSTDKGADKFMLLMVLIPVTFGWLIISSFISRCLLPVGSKMAFLRIEFHDALNTFGMLYQSLFIVIMVWIVQPFRYFSHPEGSAVRGVRHVVKYPDVQVESPEHVSMTGLAVFCLLAYGISFIAFYGYHVVRLPQQAAQSPEKKKQTLRGFRFMFQRFNPDTWYHY